MKRCISWNHLQLKKAKFHLSLNTSHKTGNKRDELKSYHDMPLKFYTDYNNIKADLGEWFYQSFLGSRRGGHFNFHFMNAAKTTT